MSKQNDLLNVGIKKGTFYLSQDHPSGDGWEKQEFSNPKTGEPMVKYHKNVTIEGKLNYLAMREDTYKGMCLNAIIGGEEESYSLQVPIMNATGSVKATNEYFNSIVGVFEKLEKGDYVKMFINNKNKDKNDRLYRNIVVLDEDGKLIKSDFSFKDVPNWESTTTVDDFGKEKKTWNPSPANKFFIEKFKAIAEKWESARTAKKEEDAKEESKEKEPEQTPEKPKDSKKGIVDNHDDLPF